MCSHRLHILRFGFFGRASLLSYVGKEQRDAQSFRLLLIVIPEGEHTLIRLSTLSEIVAALHVFIVLVIGKDGMQLVGVPFITHPQGVVPTTCHVPVAPAEQALVVERQLLPAYLRKQPLSPFYFCPSFVQRHAPVHVFRGVLSPDTDVLYPHPHRQFRQFLIVEQAHILHRQPGTVVDEGRSLLVLVERLAGTIAVFASRAQLHIQRELVFLLTFFLRRCRHRQKQHSYYQIFSFHIFFHSFLCKNIKNQQDTASKSDSTHSLHK